MTETQTIETPEIIYTPAEFKEAGITGDNAMLARIFLTGDISCLSDVERAHYVQQLCARLGLDPYMQPFKILVDKKAGTSKLYATKACGEQLIRINNLDAVPNDVEILQDLKLAKCTCTVFPVGEPAKAKAVYTPFEQHEKPRRAKATGYVGIDKYDAKGQLVLLRDVELANALMKCETKAVQRAVLRWVGLGLPSETELPVDTAGSISIIDEELAERGNVLTSLQRRQALAWCKENAEAYGSDANPWQIAHDALGTLGIYAQGKDQAEAIQVRNKMIAEVLEAIQLDQAETQRRRLAPKRSEALGNMPLGTPAEEQPEEKKPFAHVAETDAIANIVSPTSTDPVVNAHADEPQKEGPSPLADARAITPTIAELKGKKKPLTAEIGEKLESVLATIRQESDKRENPSWDVDRELIKQVTTAAGWPQDKIQDALRYQHHIHSESMHDPEVFTWAKITDMCIWFASKNPEAYKLKGKAQS